jgi:hypothetical protein
LQTCQLIFWLPPIEQLEGTAKIYRVSNLLTPPSAKNASISTSAHLRVYLLSHIPFPDSYNNGIKELSWNTKPRRMASLGRMDIRAGGHSTRSREWECESGTTVTLEVVCVRDQSPRVETGSDRSDIRLGTHVGDEGADSGKTMEEGCWIEVMQDLVVPKIGELLCGESVFLLLRLCLGFRLLLSEGLPAS